MYCDCCACVLVGDGPPGPAAPVGSSTVIVVVDSTVTTCALDGGIYDGGPVGKAEADVEKVVGNT